MIKTDSMLLFFFSASYIKDVKQGDQITAKITKSVNDRATKLFYVHSLMCLIMLAEPQAAKCLYLGNKHEINFFPHLSEPPIFLGSKYRECVCMFNAGCVKFPMHFYTGVSSAVGISVFSL